MKKVYVKNRVKQRGQFQFYMHQFVEAAIKNGITPQTSLIFDFSVKMKKYISLVRHSCFALFLHKKRKVINNAEKIDGGIYFRRLALFFYHHSKKKKAILITSRGETLFQNAFPFFYNYEIVPMLWDVWPKSWDSLYRDLKLFDCKIVFVTVKAMAEKIKSDLGIQAYWIPEGIDKSVYVKGKELHERTIEIYELGRQQKEYHVMLENLYQKGVIKQYCRNIYNKRGELQQLAYPTADSLIAGLPDIKIIISFPQVDTHPEKAGGLDTLTQRYWEAMLSRCLIIGRAPQELIDLVGYNPVVAVDWEDPLMQIETILHNISAYQSLVDKNYITALENAAWDSRIHSIVKIVKDEGYLI